MKYALENKYVTVGLSLTLTAVIAYLDYISGYRIAFSIFYLLPIGLITWYVGREAGQIFISFAILIWFSIDYITTPPPHHTLIHFWNALVRLGFFVIVNLLLVRLKNALEIEQQLARVDFLTGIPNRHDFTDFLHQEMERCRRHQRSFTLAYIDCDNFKKVNDTLGHEQGDLLLKEVANCLVQHTRKTDKAARIGGDEFVILLTETNETRAREILLRLHVKLLTVMELYKWPVTFSIGAVTFEDMPLTTQDAIGQSDQLMYQAKQNGKNQLATKTIRSVVEQANKRWS